MMRRLTSAPKPALRVRSYIVAERPLRRRASRSARRRTARGSSWPRPSRPGSRRESRSGCAAARRCERSRPVRSRRASALVERRAHVRIDARLEQAPRHADAQRRAHRRSRRRDASAAPSRAARRVVRVGAADHLQAERGILHRPRERADLIERRREGDEAVARDAAVRGFHAHDAAERRRLANRSARVRAQRERRHAGRDGHGRSAARSAGNPIGAQGLRDGPNARVLGRRSHREFVAVRLADDDRAGLLEPLDDRGVERRHVILQHLATRPWRRCRARRCCP